MAAEVIILRGKILDAILLNWVSNCLLSIHVCIHRSVLPWPERLLIAVGYG